MMKRFARHAAAALAAASILAPSPASADVVVMNSGRRLEGVVEDNPADSSAVWFHSPGGRMSIPRANIKAIEREPASVSWTRLGEMFLERDRLEEARDAFARAAEADPSDATARQRLAAAEAQLRQSQISGAEAERLAALDLLAQSRALAEEKMFEEAMGKIQAAETRAGALIAQEARAAKADLYYKWGLSSLDRMNSPRAAELFEEALRWSPGNPAYRAALIESYEKIPEKQAEVLAHYQQTLAANPGDVPLRHKVARMLYHAGDYLQSANLYLLSADQQALDTAADRELLEKSLQQIVTLAGNERDFQKARDHYARLMQLFPAKYGPGPLHYYEYYIKANQIDQKNPYDLLELAAFAAERRLNELAKANYSKALLANPEMEEAREGLSKLAQQDLAEARALLAQGKYGLAMARAQSIQQEFPRATAVLEEARVIYDKASIQAEEARRRQVDEAKGIAQQGDTYYAQAQGYLSEMRNRDFSDRSFVYSPKQEAIRYLNRAIVAWGQALQVDPSLAEIGKGDLITKIDDANRHLASLQAPPSFPRGYREIRGLRDDTGR